MVKKKKDKRLLVDNIKDIKQYPECKTYKQSLKNIIKDDIFKNNIDDAIYRTNKIISSTYEFIKLYILHCFENNNELPSINTDFITQCFIVLCKKSSSGRQTQKNNKYLEDFYKEHYEPLLINKEKTDKKNLTQILKYESIRMKTCYENSVETNYFNFLFRYINCIFTEKHNEYIEKLSDDDKNKFIKELKLELKVVKNDLLNNTLNSDIKYHEWIKNSYGKITPLYNDIKESYYYDIKIEPMKYLKYLLNMNVELEKINKKMFHAIPLRKSLIPKHIEIDTVSIIDISNINDKQKYNSNIAKFQDFLWKKYFKLENNIFKDKPLYKFNYLILTDGVSVSIIFKRNDLIGKKNFCKRTSKKDEEFEYLENYNQFELLELKEKYNIVYTDPGKCRLLYMLDEKKNKIFKYTGKQRLYETQRLKYQQIEENMKKENNIIKKETELSTCNSKSCKFEIFKKYIKVKNEINKDIENFYLDIKFRKFIKRKFINKQRSEDKMINTIKKLYTTKENGIKKEPLILIGNWSISHQMRNMISSPCIGLKRKLNKYFKMLTMDEFRTSCLNYKNEEKIENMIDKITKKKIHSVLILKEKEKVIGCINRDRNAVYNYRKIFNHYVETGKRLLHYDRTYKLE